MAVRFSLSHPIILEKSVAIMKPVKKVFMLSHSQVSVKKALSLQIRSFSRNKIFEDQCEGIVCYRDENGEITCEGYDEGPRLQRHHLPTRSCHPRDAEIIDLLQKNWLQIVKGGDLNHAAKGSAGQKDFNWNGFNTICLYLLALIINKGIKSI